MSLWKVTTSTSVSRTVNSIEHTRPRDGWPSSTAPDTVTRPVVPMISVTTVTSLIHTFFDVV